LCTSFATEPAPNRPDIDDLVADRVEHVLVLVEHRTVAADEQRELARLRARGTAGDRRIEHRDALLLELRVKAAHHRRRVRREIEPRRTGLHRFEQLFADRFGFLGARAAK
jgi:hypothetical protein